MYTCISNMPTYKRPVPHL